MSCRRETRERPSLISLEVKVTEQEKPAPHQGQMAGRYPAHGEAVRAGVSPGSNLTPLALDVRRVIQRQCPALRVVTAVCSVMWGLRTCDLSTGPASTRATELLTMDHQQHPFK